MDRVKRLIGIVAGLFCTLVVAELCSFCFKIDFIWYSGLLKPTFVPSGGWFTLMVATTYVSTIVTITRLVEHKNIFPAMIFFVLEGVFCILFVYTFFTLKNTVGGLICIAAAFAFCFVLLIRFLFKDAKAALLYLPAAAFNAYCFVTVFAITIAN